MNQAKWYDEDIQNVARGCAAFLEEKKGRDILLLDLRRVNSYLDYFLIATGNSLIHCRSLAREAQKFLDVNGLKERTRSKLDTGWIVLDYNELVIHIFTDETREYYQLEKLWADAERL